MAPKIWDVLSESKCIIKTNSRHYLILSFIFLLPLSISSLLFHNLFKHLQQPPINPTSTILFLSLLFFLLSSIFSFCAITTITYSVFHTFNRPVKLSEALKSISTSFFRLLATAIVSFTIYFAICFLFTLVLIPVFYVAIQHGIKTTSYVNLFMLCTKVILMIVLLPVVVYIKVHWSLAQVIVVVESRWGLEPLRRSASLVKGMKAVVVSSFFFFAFLQGIFGFIIYCLSINWIIILVISPFLVMLMLFEFTVNTLLYIYCKDNQSEFPKEKDNTVDFSLIPS